MACMILGSMAGWIGFAHAATMDMLFSATLCAAMILLGSWFWRKNTKDLYWFFALLGLATLAKGPVAVVLAGVVALAYIILFREWSSIPKLLLSPGILIWGVVALPWYVFCYRQNGFAFIDEFIIKHNFGRFTSTALGHGQPIWYFIPVLIAELFPWSLLLLLPVIELFRSGSHAMWRNRQKAFLFLWFSLTFVFFSLSQNKLPGYILPVLPPLALWIAMIIEGENAESEERKVSVDSLEATALQRMSVWLIGSGALLLVVIPFVIPLLPFAVISGVRQAVSGIAGHYWSAVTHGPLPVPAMFLVLAPAGFAIFKLMRRDLIEAIFFTMVGAALSIALLVEFVAPEINRVASVRTIAQRMQALNIDGSEVAMSGLNRNQSLGLAFYLNHELPEWNERSIPEAIGYVIAKDDVRVLDAQMMVLFPGQHLRLWVLPKTQFDIQLDKPPGKSL